jgi:V-type H+-transporting ATPase subunit E
MQEEQVQKQIEQMVKFIRQEAVEKAREIHVKAEEEFNIEKLRMVEAEKARIRSEYERKEKDIEITKRMYGARGARAPGGGA